jgi:hypothetical protein
MGFLCGFDGFLWDVDGFYVFFDGFFNPLVNKQFAMENCHLYMIYQLNIVIFNSYVKLPEGKSQKREYV